MKILIYLSDYIIPFTLFYIVGFGLLMKTNIYDDFVEGAKEGFKVVFNILPTLVGLMVAIGILRASGALDALSGLLTPIVRFFHFPSELVPLITVKMFSSSAATSLLLDIFKEYGPDSYFGRLASIIMSCTLAGALIATLAGIIASTIIVNMVF